MGERLSFRDAMRVVSPLRWLREFWPVVVIGLLLGIVMRPTFVIAYLLGSYGHFAITRSWRRRTNEHRAHITGGSRHS